MTNWDEMKKDLSKVSVDDLNEMDDIISNALEDALEQEYIDENRITQIKKDLYLIGDELENRTA